MSKTNQRPDAAAATVDQTTSATADETNRRDGLLAPFRFRAGARVLEVGWGTGETTAALARDGADVLVLEPVPELAKATRERFDRVSHVSVVEAWFFDWLGSPGARDERFDVVLIHAHDRPKRHRGLPWGLERDVAAAAHLLHPSGVLLILTDNPRGLRHELASDQGGGGMRTPSAPLDGHPDEPLSEPPSRPIRRLLSMHGLEEQSWWLPYPDHQTATTVVSADLWSHADGPSLARLLVRDLGPATTAESGPFDGAHAMFARASSQRIAPELADAFLIAAARGRSALEAVVQPGWLWLLPRGDLLAPWRRTRVLIDVDGAWELRPSGPSSGIDSGPFMLIPTVAPIQTGTSGEDVVWRALAAGGPHSSDTLAVLRAWRDAAESASRAVAGPYQLDLEPAAFVVTGSGAWQHMPRDVVSRMHMPLEPLLIEGLSETLGAFVRRGWPMPGLGGSTSVLELTRRLLAGIDVTVDEPTVRLWLELETDRRLRTEVGSADRDTVREAVMAEVRSEIRGSEAIERDARTALAATVEEAMSLSARLGADIERLDATVGALRAVHEELGGLRRDVERIREELAAVSGVVEQARIEQETIGTRIAEHASRMEALERADLDLRWRTLPKPGPGSRLRRDLALRLSENEQRELVAASDLFDAEWYVARYPDVARAGVDPIIHYLRHGAAEGRDPGPAFDTRAYLVEHPEVARMGVNPLVHRLQNGDGHGDPEGRA